MKESEKKEFDKLRDENRIRGNELYELKKVIEVLKSKIGELVIECAKLEVDNAGKDSELDRIYAER